jgi:hypothetical protein
MSFLDLTAHIPAFVFAIVAEFGVQRRILACGLTMVYTDLAAESNSLRTWYLITPHDIRNPKPPIDGSHQ